MIWQIETARTEAALLALENDVPRLAASDHRRAALQGGGDPDHPRARERRAIYVALRLALEQVFGAAAVRRHDLVRSALGRPSLAGCGDFSLAHVPGHALIGIARHGSIGVDIERRRAVRMADARQAAIVRAAHALLPHAPLPRASRDRFLAAWVRLEAVAKARRVGMARMLTAAGALGGTAGSGSPLSDRAILARMSALGAAGAGVGASPDTCPGPGPGSGPETTETGERNVSHVLQDLALPDGLFGAMAWTGHDAHAAGAATPRLRRLPAALDALRAMTA